ncbi:MAG: hypothetical protein HY343_10085, partial [Lentisphaerae bacterium]|nr:hypothetical protein [Lentisphaerota bacterium]
MYQALKTCLWAAPFVALSLLFQILPFNNMLLGVYKWHLTQPETVQGGMELIGVYVLCCASLVWIRNNTVVVLIIVGLTGLYLQLHHVLVSAVCAVLYVEILAAFGARVSRVMRLEPQGEP